LIFAILAIKRMSRLEDGACEHDLNRSRQPGCRLPGRVL